MVSESVALGVVSLSEMKTELRIVAKRNRTVHGFTSGVMGWCTWGKSRCAGGHPGGTAAGLRFSPMTGATGRRVYSFLRSGVQFPICDRGATMTASKGDRGSSETKTGAGRLSEKL